MFSLCRGTLDTHTRTHTRAGAGFALRRFHPQRDCQYVVISHREASCCSQFGFRLSVVFTMPRGTAKGEYPGMSGRQRSVVSRKSFAGVKGKLSSFFLLRRTCTGSQRSSFGLAIREKSANYVGTNLIQLFCGGEDGLYCTLVSLADSILRS